LRHYGHLLLGERVPPSILNAGFPAVGPIALSFRILGVGPWQGRVPGIVFTVGALGMLYYLARRLYDSSVAAVSLCVVLLLSPDPSLHPVLLGRQALGEMPCMFYLLSGYALFSWAWRRPRLFLPAATLLWGLSLRTKPQVAPFLVIALSFPLAVALVHRRYRTVALLASALLGTFAAFLLLAWGERLLLSGALPATYSNAELYRQVLDVRNLLTYVFVLVPAVRLAVALSALPFAPWAIALCHSGRNLVRKLRNTDMQSGQEVCRLSLWALVSAWLGWYLLLSIGWTRYLFPAWFVGGMFVAVLLTDLVGGFNLPRLIKLGAKVLRRRRFTLGRMAILLTVILVPSFLITTVGMLCVSYAEKGGNCVVDTARFLNTYTAPDALIETYDSELFFLLERPYHYPPPSVQHQLNRRMMLGQGNAIDYDPLTFGPDYLVVGPMSRWWRLYEPALNSGAFRLLRTDGVYQVYERLR
jgi:hypothetical protein